MSDTTTGAGATGSAVVYESPSGDNSVTYNPENGKRGGVGLTSAILGTLGWIAVISSLITVVHGDEKVNYQKKGTTFGVGLALISAGYLINPTKFSSGVKLSFDK